MHGDGQRKLVLTTEKLFDNPQIGQRIRPNLLADNRVSETMLELGIDRQLLERTPSVVLCPTRYVESMSPLPDHAIDLELNAAFTHWNHEPTASTKSAALLFRRALPFRLTSFEPASPFRIGDEMRLVSQPMPGGTAARQAYLQAMMRNSPAVLIDGGDFLPLGQDDVLRSVRKLLATLPTTAQISEIVKQPVIVRTYSENNQAIIVVMNTAPWRVDAEIALDTPQPTTLEPVLTGTDASNPDRVKPRAILTGRQPWNVSLEPYDLKAVRIGAAGIKVEEVHVTLDDTANSELKHRLDNLANRNLSAPHAYRALANPNFEPVGGAGAVPGWHLVGNPSTATAVLDAISPQDGKTCLYLRSNGQLAALESDPFPIPATGQLSMTVFARSQSTAPGTELRLVFEGESEGQAFRRATEGVDPKHENQQWSPYAILVSDLPLDSRGEMRIKFEVTGPGEFWLDNVNLNDILLPLKYYNNASAEIVKLLQRTHDVQAAYDGGQLNDCIQLLDGYWPRFVMAYTPPSAPAVALLPRPQNSLRLSLRRSQLRQPTRTSKRPQALVNASSAWCHSSDKCED